MKLPSWSKPFLIEKHRYKIAHGGRGSGKSTTFCLMLLIVARRKKTRILCCREIQTSIRSSVHQLLSNLIYENGWQYEFKITALEIRHKECGSVITFAGLKNNPESVKSTEGIDICYIEEAQTISEQSMRLLIPTVRTPGSEIWMAMNPRYNTDYVWTRFVQSPSTNVLSKRVNYVDNPWFPEVLLDEMTYDKENDYGLYAHTWLGELRPYGARPAFSADALLWKGTELHREPDIYGLDLSYSGKNALVGICVSEDGRILSVLSSPSSTHVPLQKMSEWIGDIDNTIVVDSARPEVIQLLRDQGYTVRGSKKGAGSVIRGIDKLNKYAEIHFYAGTEDAYEEMSKLGFDAIENLIGDRDFTDAIRYGVEKLNSFKALTWGEIYGRK